MRRIVDTADLGRTARKGRTAVLFHATWCPFCRAFRPSFEAAVADMPGVVAAEAILDDEDDPMWLDWSVDVVPTVVLFQDGHVAARLDGEEGLGLIEADLRVALAREFGAAGPT